MMVIPTASCMLLCVGLSEAIEPDSRKHFLPASHVSSSLGFTAEAEYGVAQTPVISYPLKLLIPQRKASGVRRSPGEGGGQVSLAVSHTKMTVAINH
jgi:hypothetical protein